MPSLKDVDLGTRIAAIFKGEHGTGKSIAASSFPRPHFFFFEQRWKSLYTYWLKNNPDKLEEITYDNLMGQSKFAIDQAIKAQIDRPMAKTLVFDSVTSAADGILGRLVHKGGITREGGEKGKQVGGIDVNVLEDFGGEDSQFRDWKDWLFNFQGNIIFICHVLLIERTDASGKALPPSRTIVTGGKKVAAKLPIWFDEVYHFQAQDGKYEILTQHAGIDFAKTSLPLDNKIEFTNGSLYDLIQANLEKNKEELIRLRQKQEEIRKRVVQI